MRVLAIDTATTALVTGVVDTATGQTTERVLEDTRAHNELLIPTIADVLAEAGMEYSDLDAVVTGVGPGPFTGLRVGMATASALADALSIPLHGVCTHDAIAYAAGLHASPADAGARPPPWWLPTHAAKRSIGPPTAPPILVCSASLVLR